MTKICFILPSSYPLFNGKIAHVFGGSEVRGWLLGTGLSRLMHNQVSFVVCDYGQSAVERYGDIDVYAHPAFPVVPKARRRYLVRAIVQKVMRRIYGARRLPSALTIDDYCIPRERFAIYEQIDADIYCTFGVGNSTADIIAYCHQGRKYAVLFAGSEVDFSEQHSIPDRTPDLNGNLAYLCYYAIMNSDLIITQTNTQERLLRERFGKKSIVIGSPIDISTRVPQVPYTDRTIALWIGKSDTIKQPEFLLQLAASYPNVPFIMVMNRVRDDIFEKITARIPPNVQLVERMPFVEIENLFARSFVLVNTSQFEGFPNTFLQAGKYGVPILSLQVDPDDFVERYHCGVTAAGDLGKFIAGLQTICDDQAGEQRFSRHVAAYVTDYHSLEEKVKQVDETLQRLVKQDIPKVNL